MTTELDTKIIRQVEYYFSDANLLRDRFLQEEIKKDDGWVSVETMLKFKRLASMSSEGTVIVDALRKSESGLLDISEDSQKIRRAAKFPVPEMTEELKKEAALKTVYCKGLDKNATLDDLLEFFKEFPNVLNVSMRYYGVKPVQNFKGTALVQFETREQAEKFMEVEAVKFKDVTLFRQWYDDWHKEKEESFQKKDEVKKAKLEKTEKEKTDLIKEMSDNIEHGSILYITDLDGQCDWKDVKDAFAKFIDGEAEIKFVDVEKDDDKMKAFVRLPTAELAKSIKEKIGETFKVKDADAKVAILEGEAEVEYIKNTASRRVQARGAQRGGKRPAGRGGRGGRGGYRGRGAKRPRRD